MCAAGLDGTLHKLFEDLATMGVREISTLGYGLQVVQSFPRSMKQDSSR